MKEGEFLNGKKKRKTQNIYIRERERDWSNVNFEES
jgi:hypothetical protein